MPRTAFVIPSPLPCRTAIQHAGEARQLHCGPPNGGGNPRKTMAEARATGIECACPILQLQFDHVEVALGRAAFRTNPVVRNVGPSCAPRQPFVGSAFFLVIDIAAGPALPGFVGLGAHRDFPSCMERRFPAEFGRVLARYEVILLAGCTAVNGTRALHPPCQRRHDGWKSHSLTFDIWPTLQICASPAWPGPGARAAAWYSQSSAAPRGSHNRGRDAASPRAPPRLRAVGGHKTGSAAD